MPPVHGPEPPNLTLLASRPQRFQGEVPASCTIEPLPSNVALLRRSGRLVGATTPFQVKANAPVQLRLGRIQKLAWPQNATGPGMPEPIATLVGNGPYRIHLELIPPAGQLLPAGDYRVAVELDCILTAP